MAKGETDFAGPIIAAAADVTKAVAARVLFVFAAAVDDLASLKRTVKAPTKLIVICTDEQQIDRTRAASVEAMSAPAFNLSRMAQIKLATILALSQGILRAGDVFVFLSGLARATIDTIVCMRVGEESEILQSVGQPKLTEHIKRAVFEKVLRLTLELAHEGREGKPVGTIFVVGDPRGVDKYCSEGRINPFKGYTEKERNILDDSIDDTVKELAKMDGAFVLKGNGVITSACAMLRSAVSGEPLPQGLGARHVAAAAITACTQSVAITLSESTGDVRVWRRGTMITEIEKSPIPGPGGPPLPATS